MEPAALSKLVEYIVKSLVDHPEQVSVSEVQNGNAVTIEVTVADSDTGRVIGRNGRVINAIRNVVYVSTAAAGRNITLEVV